MHRAMPLSRIFLLLATVWLVAMTWRLYPQFGDAVRADGRVAEKGGAHLTGRQHLLRDKIVAAIEHKRSAAMKPTEAVADYIRDAAFTAMNRA